MNKIFVLSGPSGTGKTTLINILTGKYNCLEFSISHTTRNPRDGEVNGREYYFIDRDKFNEMIDQEGFAEWAEVHGELYGTSLSEINSKSAGDKILVLDIDVQGAEIIKKRFPLSLLIFIKPPGLSELKRRIKKREGELTADFQERIRTAESEISRSGFYDHTIINDDLDKSLKRLEEIFLKYRKRVISDDPGKKEGGE